jgi:hypothetical protein
MFGVVHMNGLHPPLIWPALSTDLWRYLIQSDVKFSMSDNGKVGSCKTFRLTGILATLTINRNPAAPSIVRQSVTLLILWFTSSWREVSNLQKSLLYNYFHYMFLWSLTPEELVLMSKRGSTQSWLFCENYLAHWAHFEPSQPPKPWPAAIASPQEHLYTLPTSSSTSAATSDHESDADLAIRMTNMVWWMCISWVHLSGLVHNMAGGARHDAGNAGAALQNIRQSSTKCGDKQQG